MRKRCIVLYAIALCVAMVSCKKDDVKPREREVSIPEYVEGVYHPIMKIATVSEDGAVTEEWNWVGENLDKIVNIVGGEKIFTYTGDQISKVINSENEMEETRYYYDQNNAFSSCEIYYGGVKAVTLNFTHNAAGKLANAEIFVEDNFLLTLAGSLLGGGFAFEKLLGRATIESMVMMAKIAQNDSSKFSIGTRELKMNLEWEGENLKSQIIEGYADILLDTNDLSLIQQIVDIPEEYLGLIQIAMLYGGGLPVTFMLSDTVLSTFDTNYNPMFCNWGMALSAENLSLNNVLTSVSAGGVGIKLSLMGQSMDLYNRSFDDYKEYIYQYNNKKYPTQVSGSKEIIYTYKQ